MQRYYYDKENYITYTTFWQWPTCIVFLHWMWASHKSRSDLIKYYPLEDYTLYAMDLKWYWYSSKPTDDKYSIADQGDILTAWITSLNLQNVVIVWHSLGGGAALYMYRMGIKNNTNRINKIVLIASMAYKNELPILYNLLANRYTMWFLYTFSTAHFKAKYTLLWACRKRKDINEKMITKYAEFLQGDDFKYVIMKSAQTLIRKDYEDTVKAYAKIQIPVLIVRWENDPVLPVSHAKELHKIIPHSELVIFPKCGHIVHEEETHKTYKVIDTWLDKHT